MDTRASIARGATSLYFANIIVLVANTMYFLLLTNILRSTLEVGILTALNLMIILLVTVSLLAQPITIQSPIPAPLAVLKFVPDLLAKGAKRGAAKTFRFSLGFTGFLSGLIATVLIASPGLVISWIGGKPVRPEYVGFAAVDVVILSVAQVCLATVIALGDLKAATWYIVFWSALRYASASALLLNYRISGVLLGFIIGDGALFVVALRSSILGLRGGSESLSLTMPEFLSYSLPTLVSALMGFAVNQADKIFALAQQGLGELAIYNVAIVASSLVGSAPFALLTVLVPSLSGLWAAKRIEHLRETLRAYTRYVSIVVIPLAVGFASVTEVALRIFGPEYVQGFIPSVIVSVGTGLTAVGVVYASLLFALGELKWYVTANLAGLLALFAVSALLTPMLGLSGPALGRAALLCVEAILYALATSRRGFFGFDIKAFLSATGGSVVMGLVVFLGISSVHIFYFKLLLLPFLIALGGLIYFASLRSLRLLTPGDLEFAAEMVPNRLRWLMPKIHRFFGVAGRKS